MTVNVLKNMLPGMVLTSQQRILLLVCHFKQCWQVLQLINALSSTPIDIQCDIVM